MTISNPEWTHNAGIYSFAWPDINIHATLDRIISEGKTLSGELKLFHRVGDKNKFIEQSRLNLLSDRSRGSMAKALSERNTEIDWLNILKYISALTVEHYRQGEPVQHLGLKPETMEITYQLYPILEFGEPTTIFAQGGTGKSYLADYIAILIQYNVCGIGDWLPTQSNVLYLDWEASKKDHERRIWALMQGLNINSEDTILYRYCTQPLADDIHEIQRLVIEHNIGFVIVDSQVAASGGDQDKADSANQYYNALRSLRCTSLTIDHVTKSNGINGESKGMPYGSIFKWNRSRSQFELKKFQEPGENSLQLALYHRKHNEGTLMKPLGLKLDFVKNGLSLDKVIVSKADVNDTPELVSGETSVLKDRIADLLGRKGLMQTKDMALELDANEASIKARLNDNKGMFKHFKDGWGLLINE